ncbi:MAG: SMC-Scp complex subunit ScpB [archaeon]|jgi:segregation and condensation protein B|nr:SMC-Scp complex subunit ScpB [archaeon]
MKKTLEAALFISGRRMDTKELADLVESDESTIVPLLDELVLEYGARNSPLEIIHELGEYKMDIDSAYLHKVKAFAPQMDMSRALVKVLSFIAYKQPVKQSIVVQRFGNRVYDYVKDLLGRGLIKADPYERTRMLSTTYKLVEYLGEGDASDMKEKIDAAKTKFTDIKARKEEKLQKKPLGISLSEIRAKKDLSANEWENLLLQEKVQDTIPLLDKFEKAHDESDEDDELEFLGLKKRTPSAE